MKEKAQRNTLNTRQLIEKARDLWAIMKKMGAASQSIDVKQINNFRYGDDTLILASTMPEIYKTISRLSAGKKRIRAFELWIYRRFFRVSWTQPKATFSYYKKKIHVQSCELEKAHASPVPWT